MIAGCVWSCLSKPMSPTHSSRVELLCKLGPNTATVSLDNENSKLCTLRSAIRDAFALGDDVELKILAKGKALAHDEQVAGTVVRLSPTP